MADTAHIWTATGKTMRLSAPFSGGSVSGTDECLIVDLSTVESYLQKDGLGGTPWDHLVDYVAGDIVTYTDNVFYKCLVPNRNVIPPSDPSKWQALEFWIKIEFAWNFFAADGFVAAGLSPSFYELVGPSYPSFWGGGAGLALYGEEPFQWFDLIFPPVVADPGTTLMGMWHTANIHLSPSHVTTKIDGFTIVDEDYTAGMESQLMLGAFTAGFPIDIDHGTVWIKTFAMGYEENGTELFGGSFSSAVGFSEWDAVVGNCSIGPLPF